MNKPIFFLSFLALSAQTLWAADAIILWGQNKPNRQAQIKAQAAPSLTQANYALKPIAGKNPHDAHQRYQQTYKGLPIFGYELISHQGRKQTQFMTGTQIQGIEKDLPSLNAQYDVQSLEQQILSAYQGPIRFKEHSKIIYIDEQLKAHLAYHLSFYTQDKNQRTSAPHFIIDANTAQTLKQWNAINSEQMGQGPGGNTVSLPYRQGAFQYGDILAGIPSLGKFSVDAIDGYCYVQNKDIRVLSLDNQALGYGVFPVTQSDEDNQKLRAFSYPCSGWTQYVNFNDMGQAPINYAFSAINDTMYFAEQTMEMYQRRYHIEKPLGDDLPLRAFTHLGRLDNAFAIPTLWSNGKIIAHQQIVIGNGDKLLTAPSQSVIAHELSHNFTALHSGLIYDGQSGGINEAFSDMAAIALQDYIRQQYPWYWDGQDWSLGREAMLDGSPLRYMDEPSKDGHSISHASDYRDWLDVHHSSGVFNKAFYLLAHQPHWSVQKAFQVMIDANQNYWSPIAYYDFAACGVIQAAIDRGYDADAVILSFAQVGVNCPVNPHPV